MNLYSTQLLTTPAVHRTSVSGALDVAWSYVHEKIISTAAVPLSRIARTIILGWVEISVFYSSQVYDSSF